jgi:hypothetical protein
MLDKLASYGPCTVNIFCPPQQRFLFFSEAYLPLTGVHPRDFPPEPRELFLQRTHPWDLENIFQVVRVYNEQILALAPPERLNYLRTYAYRYQHTDGHWLWMLEQLLGLRLNDENRMERVLAVLQHVPDVHICPEYTSYIDLLTNVHPQPLVVDPRLLGIELSAEQQLLVLEAARGLSIQTLATQYGITLPEMMQRFTDLMAYTGHPTLTQLLKACQV